LLRKDVLPSSAPFCIVVNEVGVLAPLLKKKYAPTTTAIATAMEISADASIMYKMDL